MLITYPDIFGTHTAMFASKLVQDTHEHSFRFGSKRSATSAQDDLRKDNTIPNASLSPKKDSCMEFWGMDWLVTRFRWWILRGSIGLCFCVQTLT